MHRGLLPFTLILLVVSGCQQPQLPADAPPVGVERIPMEGQVPYSAAVRVGNMLYVSGMLGVDTATGQLVSGGIQTETRQALENLNRILDQAGTSIDRVVKCLVMIDDMAEFPQMNEVYTSFFADNLPARSSLGADGLALGGAVEIECMAAVG